MRPEDRRVSFDDLLDAGMDLPFDAALESLDADLAHAGERARRMLYGRSQPTRVFTNALRARILSAVATPVVAVPVAGASGGAAAVGTMAAVAATGSVRAGSTPRRAPGTTVLPQTAARQERLPREWTDVELGSEAPAPVAVAPTAEAGRSDVTLRVGLALLAAAGLLVIAALGGSVERLFALFA